MMNMMDMIDRNPTIDPPHIPSPDVYTSNTSNTSPSRSQSRSPSRHKRNFSKSHDPLLRDLSPTSTLRAFTAAASATAGKSEDQLVRSIEAASSSERAFGARIVQTCKDIRVWHDELQLWDWPGTFEEPPDAEKGARRVQLLLKNAPHGIAHAHSNGDGGNDDTGGNTLELFWGCLPHELVVGYERRVDEIRDALEELDVEDLKNHVLNAHMQPRSQQPAYGTPAHSDMTSSLQRLDDFTALITATILQALPHLSRLYALLNTWSIRLLVLRKVPAFLRELKALNRDIEASWSALAVDIKSDGIEASMLRSKFDDTHRQLGKRVSRLGARLDSVLDDLEGREEVLPEHWIDAFEALEAAYSEWVMQTERELMTRDLNLAHMQSPAYSACVATPADQLSAQAQPGSAVDPEPPIGLGVSSGTCDANSVTSPVTSSTTSPSSQIRTQSSGRDERTTVQPEPESPVLGSGNAVMFGSTHDQDVTDSEGDLSPPAVDPSDKQLTRRSVPPLPEVDLSRQSSLQRAQSPRSFPAPSPARSRHIPILVGYDDKEAVQSSPSSHPALNSRPAQSSAPLREEPTNGQSLSAVRARAAFLNRGLEQTQTLQKSVNSPVRPFEHASQAFTKLFSRANSAQHSAQHSSQHSRSTSTSSRSSSLRKGFGIGQKKDLDPPLERSTSSLPSLHSTSYTGSAPHSDAVELPVGLPVELPVELPAEPVLQSGPSDQGVSGSSSTSAAEISARDAFVTPETQYGFEPSTHESKSTIESAWNSPAFSDLSQNWPLPLRLNEEEITSPKQPIDAIFFEEMFVDSLPASPDGLRFNEDKEDYLAAITHSPSKRVQAKEALLGRDRSLSESQRYATKQRPRHIPIASGVASPPAAGALPDVATPASLQSTVSTPEVQSASAAGYFKPKEVRTPPSTSRISDALTTKRDGDQRSSWDFQTEKASQSSPQQHPQSMTKRASVASIENFARSAVKTIEIPDAPKMSSNHSSYSPASPTKSASLSPGNLRSAARQRGASLESTPSIASSVMDVGLVAPGQAASEPLPKDISIPKRRKAADVMVAASSCSDSDHDARSQRAPEKRSHHKRNISEAEQIDRQVSRVLSSLPNRINFTPAGSSIGESAVPSEPAKGSVRSRSRLASASRASLTLTPAQQDEKSKKSRSADSEVKLYHLSQEGRDQPIKLYVRLVGEGERVMVRVGGGWADLGEYLRQYAEHHGRRTISDGRLEVAGASKPATGSKTRTPLSRPASVLDRPTSRFSQRRRSSANTPQYGGRADSPGTFSNRESAMTPTPPGTSSGDASQNQDTPKSISTKSGSRPSTAEAALSTSPASWDGADIGLAGPASKRGKELDQHKARWVEDMIERAKQASVEKKSHSAGKDGHGWAGLGKMGGTRRVIFRNQHQQQQQPQPQKEG